MTATGTVLLGQPDDDSRPEPMYPVVDSAELHPVNRRRFRRARREIHEIPRQPPGTVLVFQLGDSYETVASGSLRLDDEVVVEAVAVAVVSVRHTLCEAVAYLATSDPSTCVAIRARFHCWVTDPVLVVDSGCWDVQPFLTDHLVAERRLRFLAADCDPRVDWPAFHRNLTAWLFAFHDITPLIVPGLTARLVDLAVELQHLASAPRPRPRPDTDALPGPPTDPGDDGDPAFVQDFYSWGDDEK
jgi:hypothetical protein